MFFWLLRSTFTLLLAAAVCALAVTVPVGRRTLFEHAVAIFTTEPARQLGEDLATVGTQISSRVQQALAQSGNPAPEQAGHSDGADEP